MSLQHSGRHSHYKLTGKAAIPAATLLAGTISTFVQDLVTALGEGSVQQKTNVTPVADTSTKQITNVTPIADTSAQQQVTVTFLGDVAGSLNNTYWYMSSPTVDYYIWYNINGAGVDPAVAGKTGIAVAAPTGATATTIKDNTAGAISALSTIFTAVSTASASVLFENVVYGVGKSATADGATHTSFTI